MPRLVQYCMPRLSVLEAAAVGPPWHFTSNGGFSPGGGRIVGIVRRIEQAERGVAAGGRKLHALDPREVIRDAQVRAIEQVGRFLQDACAGRIARSSATTLGGMIGGAGAEHRRGRRRRAPSRTR